MNNNRTFCINENAENINDIFFNEHVNLIKLEDLGDIYDVLYEGEKTNYILKMSINKFQHYSIEVKNLEKLKDVKGIPRMYSYGKNSKCKFILMEKIEADDLFTLCEKKLFSENTMRDIARKALKILKIIHKRGVLHLDIKPENILYNEKTKKVYIIDFEQRTTVDYCAPECSGKTTDTIKGDIWSLGITIYCLIMGNYPFRYLRKGSNEKEIVINNSKISYELNNLLLHMLDKNIETRYTVDDCLNHSWFKM